MAIKIMSWNVEHAAGLLKQDLPAEELGRRDRVRRTFEDINADIICLVEGPKGEQAIADLCHLVLNDQWSPITLRQAGEPLGARDAEYGNDLRGTQWVWFLVKPGLTANCQLQAPAVWQGSTGGSTWNVHPWGRVSTVQHSHYRHPQVLSYDLGSGQHLEFIGVHLKSKINKDPIQRDPEGNLVGSYLDTALTARIKLATEARNVRDYVGARLDGDAGLGIVVMGDCNDGPGQDYFERNYLFFDLLANIQGNVITAERFFNHALFDYDPLKRWTAKYDDKVENIPAPQNPLLLDHILLSQTLCNGTLGLVVNPHAGAVEHDIYDHYNAGHSGHYTSDHRPVTCLLTDTP